MGSSDESNSSRAIPQSYENGGAPSHPVSTKTLRKVSSPVWDHFEELVVAGETKAKCLHCDKIFTAGSKNETSELKDHLEKRCSKKNQKVDMSQKGLSASSRVDGTGIIDVNSSYSNHETSRRELANMVIIHEYPLAMVDHIGFCRFVTSLNPSFKISSRNTLRSDIMEMFLSEKTSLKKLLKNSKSKIAITIDIWTASNPKRSYMVITGHYIDQFWVLHNKILRFAYVPFPHTKDVLAQVLLKTLDWYNITEKIASVVIDNCSTTNAMLDVLRPRLSEDFLILKGKFLHMTCTAHTLNWIAQSWLDVISEGIEKIRDCVSFWVATPKRIKMFEDKVKSMKGEEAVKIALDCRTMWNSTFRMLQSVLPYTVVFTSIKCQNPRLNFTLPTQEDWELAALVCEKLKKFHKLSKLFSGRKYPTSNLFFCQVCEIKLDLITWLQSDIQVIRDMAEKMTEKYDKYWMIINEVLAIAAILDPRKKLECVEFYFTKIYGSKADLEIQRIKDTMYDLFLEYQDRVLSTEGCDSNAAQANMHQVDDGDEWSRVKKTKKRKLNAKSELDRYLERDILPEIKRFDILEYWSIEDNYPIMQRIVKDIIAIPASIIVSESAFSIDGRFLSLHRSKLSTSTVEALICMQNWIMGDLDSGTSLHTIEALTTIFEDQDTVDLETEAGNNFGSENFDLDLEDEDRMDFM